jgi:hypothetical protein
VTQPADQPEPSQLGASHEQLREAGRCGCCSDDTLLDPGTDQGGDVMSHGWVRQR